MKPEKGGLIRAMFVNDVRFQETDDGFVVMLETEPLPSGKFFFFQTIIQTEESEAAINVYEGDMVCRNCETLANDLNVRRYGEEMDLMV